VTSSHEAFADAQQRLVDALASQTQTSPQLAHGLIVACIVGHALGRRGEPGFAALARALAAKRPSELAAHVLDLRAHVHERLPDAWAREHEDQLIALVARLGERELEPLRAVLLALPRPLPLDPFGPAYARWCEPAEAAARGQVFTTPVLAERMLSELGYVAEQLAKRPPSERTIIDPSCGAGVLLGVAARELVRAGVDGHACGEAIVGVDVDPFALHLAGMSLALQGVEQPRLDVTHDALAHFLAPEQQGELGRYAFVIGNPPYVSYNHAAARGVELLARIKARERSLADVHGWNLHSAPGRRKKYPPKPNLYAFFLALGVALLAPGGRLAYLLPRTLLTEPDYDVVRHHLAHDVTIDAILQFDAALFEGVATSSLVLVCTKTPPPPSHCVACVRARSLAALDGEARTRLPQAKLRARVENWAFVGWDPAMVERYEHYLDHSESMQVYADHAQALARFGTRFFFDVGFILDPANVRESYDPEQHYAIVDFREFVRFSVLRPTRGHPRDPATITLPKASQGLVGLRTHKLVWPKSRAYEFYLTDVDILPSMSHAQFIGSDSRDELLFLFAVLRSSLVRSIYAAMFELGAEQHGMFVAIKRIKEFVRPPKIDTPAQQWAKAEVVARVAEALALEQREGFDARAQDRLLDEVDALVLGLYGLP
jgi:hypothetical protein